MSYIGNAPQSATLVGQIGGDFDSVPLLDNITRGDLALHTKSINNPTQDVNGNLILSDAPTTGRFVGIVAQAIIIDTQGYQTLQITTNSTFAATGGVQFSNDGITFGVNSPMMTVSGSYSSALAANTNYSVPCLGRYARITPTTAGAITYFLRNSPAQIVSQNLVSIGNAAVSATTAQLGMSLVNIGAAAQSSTNPLNVTPLALATTNNQTIGQSIITATAAAVVQAKATPGRLTMLNISNNATTGGFLHLQNNATAATTTASVQTYVVPPSIGGFVSVPLPDGGLFLSAGIAFTVSGAIASGDATALTAPSMVVNYSFI